MNIFVGNLSFEAKEADVYNAFAAFGAVSSVAIVMEKNGRRSRGFGFVEMPDKEEARAAVAALNGREISGRPVNVMPALSGKPAVGRRQPLLEKTGRYKQGRRSVSYRKRRLASGMPAAEPARKHKNNPLRWRKKPRWIKPSGKPAPDIRRDEPVTRER